MIVPATGGNDMPSRIARLRDTADIRALRERIDKERCQRSLSRFVRRAWPYIDPADYLHNWHIDAKCEYLEALMRGECPRLIINEPPRSMKSIVCSIAFPAFVWAQDDIFGDDGVRLPNCGPHARFFYTSYSQPLATEHSVKTRDLILSPWYQANWGDRYQLKGDVNLKTQFENTKFGRRQASSVGGVATGFGGSCIGVDDPHNVIQGESEAVTESTLRFFFEVLPTRLNDQKRGAIFVVMQRVSERDVTGEIIARALGWEHLCLPMKFERGHPFVWARDPRKEDYNGITECERGEGALLWRERFDENAVATLEAALGQYASAGQLQQRPAPRSGGFFEVDKIEILDQLPVDPKGKPVKIVARVRAWDLAGTKDIGNLDPSYTVGVLMARDEAGFYYIEHVERFRENPAATEALILRCAEVDGRAVEISIPQDPGQSGKYQSQYLVRALAGYVVHEEPQSGDKGTRAKPFSSQVGAGNVRMIRGSWNRAFVDELRPFPMGRHNDQVDGAASAFNRLATPPKRAIILGGGVR